MKRIVIIGGGFAGLSAACYMAHQGCDVILLEKNKTIGGRARQYKRDGFTFDMGPTFYWMPDIFEKFFNDFGKTSGDYYTLRRLNPGYEVYFDKGKSITLSAQLDEIMSTFEQHEPGSSRFLKRFLRDAGFNYDVAINKVVYKPGKSPLELVMPATVMRSFQFVSSLSHTVRRNIKSPYLRQILEFPVIFLGAKPSDIPAFYCFMNYADMVLGTWHIQGGMYNLVEGMKQLALSLGVQIRTSAPVDNILTDKDCATGITVGDEFIPADVVISGADYHHSETLLDPACRNYTEKYWSRKVMAPSALLYYVAFDRKLKNISHHTLFFDTDFGRHAANIYDTPGWPETPLFYASFPSQTDPLMAPEGKEAGVFLIPIAAGLQDTLEIREKYFNEIIGRMEHLTGQVIRPHVLFKESYAGSNFVKDYNAYKGNAYGLANILLQTAFLKPKVSNKKLPNLFYTGQLTVPGPGVPPAIISGKIAAELALEYLNKSTRNG